MAFLPVDVKLAKLIMFGYALGKVYYFLFIVKLVNYFKIKLRSEKQL
jgi:hypothetical protein